MQKSGKLALSISSLLNDEKRGVRRAGKTEPNAWSELILQVEGM
jgi:hypothetical protein